MNSYISINEKELEALLNLKFEKIEELDLLEDEFDGFKLTKEEASSSQEKKEFFKSLKNIPTGNSGITYLKQSSTSKRFEERLQNLIPVIPSGKPFQNVLSQLRVYERSHQHKEKIQKAYDRAVLHIEHAFNEITKGNRLDYARISKIVKPFTISCLTDRAMVQNLSTFHCVNPDYLANHIIRVCLLSLNIATASGFSVGQVQEIGEAAILADIGMIMVDGNIRFKKEKLSSNDRFEILKHPIVGLHALERIKGLPDPVAFASYQHHERLLGSGYPKNRIDRLIHTYSKIIAIADIFESLCSERAYRKAYHPSHAMKMIQMMAVSGELEKEYVANFINFYSAFPVGTLVILKDKRIAKVIEANQLTPMQPVVSILTDTKNRALPEDEIYQVDCAEEDDLEIMQPLKKLVERNEIMAGF